MNNSHIFPVTCHAGLSYFALFRERLRWAQLGLIQNLQAMATVQKKTNAKGRPQFREGEYPYIVFSYLLISVICIPFYISSAVL